MKKLYCIIVTLFITLFSVNVFAFSPPPAPEKGFYVSDQSGKMSQLDISRLNQKIDRISKSTKNEFGILLLQDMGGDNIEDVANTTFKSWGIGKRGLDNGCLIVVAIKERKSRIETGKGVEGEVTDLQASDILKKNLNPHLRSGNFFGGFSDTLDALSSLIESRHASKADPIPASNSSPAKTAVPSNSASCSSSPSKMSSENELLLFFISIGAIAVIYGYISSKRKARELKQAMIDAELEYQAAQKKAAALAHAKQEAEARRQAEKKKKADQDFQLELERQAKVRKDAIEASLKEKEFLKEKVIQGRKLRESVAQASVASFVPVVTSASPAIDEVFSETKKRRQEDENRRRIKEVQKAKQEADDRRLFEENQRRLNQQEDERRRRKQQEADRRRQDEEDEDRRRRTAASLISSSSSWGSSSSDSGSSWGSTSSDSGSSFGGGFGGGDSGGGGSSSDW